MSSLIVGETELRPFGARLAVVPLPTPARAGVEIVGTVTVPDDPLGEQDYEDDVKDPLEDL